jgi:bacterioferritin-associated ferredoxin
MRKIYCTVQPNLKMCVVCRTICFLRVPKEFNFMQPDDELCLCFHVTQRKVVNFLRVEKPKRAAQLSECFGAGTGCGWCRPFLQRLFDEAVAGGTVQPDLPTAADYARLRSRYVHETGAKPPPGATPIGDES